jgi:biotin carboxylase
MGVDVYLLTGIGVPGSWEASRSRDLGSKKLPDIVDAARAWHEEERFDGVFCFSEMAVVTTAHVAEALGLPGIGVEAALKSRNKLLMHTAHDELGAAHAQFRLAATLDDALGAGGEFGYPVVLKPTLGCSSTLVFRCDDSEELELRYEQASARVDHTLQMELEADDLDLGPRGLLVESFLDGHEHLIEATVWDDEVFLGSIVDRVTIEGKVFDDDVHRTPTALTEDQVAAVHEVVTRAVHAQGLRRSVMHAEVRFHRGEPHVLEIAARPGGGGLDIMARICGDHDPIRSVVDIARGVRPRLHHYSPTGVATAAMALICPAGVVEEVVVPPEVSSHPEVFFLKITARPGDLIKRPPEGNTVFGFLGATGPSFEEAMTTAVACAERIEVRLVGARAPAVAEMGALR